MKLHLSWILFTVVAFKIVPLRVITAPSGFSMTWNLPFSVRVFSTRSVKSSVLEVYFHLLEYERDEFW